MKILVNRCYGGFGFSEALYNELGIPWDKYGYLSRTAELESLKDKVDMTKYEWVRTDPYIIAAVEKIGCEAASGQYAKLEIVDIPDDVDWEIDEYDGMEHIDEVHRSW